MSINQNTVLILGAGASYEYGFPLGADLLTRIQSDLTYEFQYGSHHTKGSPEIFDCLRRMFPQSGTGYDHDRVNEYLRAASQLAKVLRNFVSIDEAIHFFAGQKEVIEIGKIAIAWSIARAEHESLRNAVTSGRFDVTQVEGWMPAFFRLALGSLSRSEIQKAFANVTIINFNYDRSFEHYLYHALRSLDIPDEESAELLSGLKIFRPYGSLGELELQDRTGKVRFGGQQNLKVLADNIKTYTEQNHDPVLIEGIKDALSQCSVALILGFGFHRQNLEMLSLESPFNPRHVFATAKGIDAPNHAALKERLIHVLRCSNNERVRVESLTCTELFEHRRQLIELAVS